MLMFLQINLYLWQMVLVAGPNKVSILLIIQGRSAKSIIIWFDSIFSIEELARKKDDRYKYNPKEVLV